MTARAGLYSHGKYKIMTIDKLKNRADLALLVPDCGTFIELGVAAGEYAIEVLRRNPYINYVGIDRWSDHHDDREAAKAKQKIGDFGPRARVIHSTFADALPSFANESADLVYIDGYAHTGQLGGSTLRDWWPIVRPGGYLAGHDYHTAWQPTIDAVDAFVDALQCGGLDVSLTVIDDAPYPSWIIQKPQAKSGE